MRYSLPIGLALICILAATAGAQTITLDEYLDRIYRVHPFFEKESLSVAIENRAQEGLLGTEDWNLTGTSYYSHQKLLASSAFSPDRIDALGLDAAAQRAFWKTGGRLSLSWSSQFSDQKLADIVIPFPTGSMVIPTGPSEFYQHKVYASYSQPLLQNYGGKLDRLAYELSDYDIDFTEVQTVENQEDFLADLAGRFLNWVLLTEQKRIAEERKLLAEEELERTVKKRKSFLVDQVDVLRAEDAVRIAEQSLVLVESQWKALRAELSVLCRSEEMCQKSPRFDLYHIEQLPSPEDARRTLREQSRILHTLGIRRDQLLHLRDGYQEQVRPQLFLNLGAGLQGGDDRFGDAFVLDKPDMSVSLMFQYPLENRSARTNVATTTLEIDRLETEIENISLELESAAVNLLILIREMEKVLQLNQEQIESAAAKTEEELDLYNQGRSDLTFVILSRDNEQQAKLTYAQNAASYQKLILQYRALMDEFFMDRQLEQ
jgi:outer membrane protein TolC